MISTILRFDIAKQSPSDFRSAYRHVLEMLQRIPGAGEWFCGVNSPKERPIPFVDEEAVLRRLHARAELMPLKDFSASIVSDDRRTRRPGLFEITYIPRMGYLTVSLYQPDQIQSNPTGWVANIMKAVVEGERETRFAFADVYDKVEGRFQYYKSSFATFQHRQCVGWMAYVPQFVSHEELPVAAAILPAPRGSIIVAVDHAFDLANWEHIKCANQVEMDMNDLGLLAVTDVYF